MVRSSIGQEPVSTTTMDTLTPVPDPTGASTAGTDKAAGERTRARHLVRGVEPGPFSLRPLPPFRLMGGLGVSGAGRRGDPQPGSPPPLAFSPKSCGDYPPEGRDNPLGTCDFHLEFFPSRTGVVDGPRQVRGGREWDGPHVHIFGPVGEQVGEAQTDGPEHEAESR